MQQSYKPSDAAMHCCKHELTVRFHPCCAEFVVWEGRVLDHTGHVLFILQVGGEAKDAAQAGGAICVKGFAHIHGKDVT